MSIPIRSGRLAWVCALALCCLQCASDKGTGTPQPTITLQLAGSLAGLSAEDVVVVGNLAYVADQDSVLVVVDVTDRAAPVVLGNVGKTGNENGVALDVAGSYAYVAVEADGVYIVDVSQAANPTTVGIFPGAYAKDVAVVDTLAYVADQDYGLRIVDVSDPTAPVLLGGTPSDGPFGVAVDGDYAYCADNDSGFCVVDISDPTTPVIVGRYRALQSTRHVEVQGNYAFLADDGTGPVILDITDPAHPALTASYPGRCTHLRVEGNYVYVSMGFPNGLAALGITQIAFPQLLDSIATPTRTVGLDVDSGYVYVAADTQFLLYSK